MIKAIKGIFVALAVLATFTAPLSAQSDAKRYIVSVRDAPDTGIIKQKMQRLGHNSKVIGKNMMLVTETPRARGGRPNILDSLLAIKRSRRTSQGTETVVVEEDVFSELSIPDNSNVTTSTPLSTEPGWNITMTGAPIAWLLGATGQGIVVASIDAAGGYGHPGLDLLGGWVANSTIGTDTTAWKTDPNCNGHGTHVSGTMHGKLETGVGMAPLAKGVQMRVFEFVSCGAYTSSTIRGINYAATNYNARVFNVSIGHLGTYSGGLLANQMRSENRMICGANGNDGAYGAYWPAADSSAVGVAAVDASNNRASWSRTGPTTDFSAPGVGINSTMPGGGYGTKSGTSMASPHVCGAIAQLMSLFPTTPVDTLIKALKETAIHGSPNPNDNIGYGLIQVHKAVAYLKGGAATDWTSRSYPAGTVIDSVLNVCVTDSCTATATGGITILRQGLYTVFSANGPGTIDIRKSSGSVPPPPPTSPQVIGLSVSPKSATVVYGDSTLFSVVGIWSDGSQSNPGAIWSAHCADARTTGYFIARSNCGPTRVPMYATFGSFADTAWVNIVAPATPSPPPITSWSSQISLGSNGGYSGIAASDSSLYVVMTNSNAEGPIRFRKSSDEGQTWTPEASIATGVPYLEDALVASGQSVALVYFKNLVNISDFIGPRAMGQLFSKVSLDRGVTWGPERSISSINAKGFRQSTTIAGNSIHTVWMDYRSGQWELYYAKSTNLGGSWNPERMIVGGVPSLGASRPQITSNNQTITITWMDDRDNLPPCPIEGGYLLPKCSQVYLAQSFDGGTTWGPQRRMTTGTSYGGRPEITSYGNTILLTYDGGAETGNTELFLLRSADNGVTWAAPIRMTNNTGYSTHSSLTLVGQRASMQFIDSRAGGYKVWSRDSFDGGLTWSLEEQLSTGDAGAPLNTSTTNRVAVAWAENGTWVFRSRPK